MHTRASCLTRGVEPAQVGAAAQVSADATHEVVCRGAHRDQIGLQIERILRQKSADSGKALVEIDAFHVAHVEVHNAHSAWLRSHAFTRDGARNYVAGSEFEQRMI